MTATELDERANACGTKIFTQITMGLGRNYPNFPAPSMAQELAGCGAVVYEIGDGQQVSTILHAVWDGYEVGNNI